MVLPADPALLARAETWNLTTDAGDLDVTTQPSGTTGYDDLAASAYRQTLPGGLHINIASLEDIIRSKTAAGRAKDLATLPQLHAALHQRDSRAS